MPSDKLYSSMPIIFPKRNKAVLSRISLSKKGKQLLRNDQKDDGNFVIQKTIKLRRGSEVGLVKYYVF